MPGDQLQHETAQLLALIQQATEEQKLLNNSYDNQISALLNKKNEVNNAYLLQINMYKQYLSILQMNDICAEIEKSLRTSDALRLTAKLLTLKFETFCKSEMSPETHIDFFNMYNSLLTYQHLPDDGLLYATNNLQPLIVMAIAMYEFPLLSKLADVNIRLYNNQYLLSIYDAYKTNPALKEQVNILEKICVPPKSPDIITQEEIEKPTTPAQILLVETPSPESFNLEEFELISLPTNIILTPEEKIVESINGLNYQEFNRLLAENKNLKDHIFQTLQIQFEKNSYKHNKIKEFLLGTNIEILTCVKLLQLKKTNINTKKALLDKIITFGDAEYYEHYPNPVSLLNMADHLKYDEIKGQIKNKNDNCKTLFSQPALPDTLSSTSSIKNLKNPDINKPKPKHKPKKERQDVFYLIEHATEKQNLDISLAVPDSLNATNTHKQTALMLALQKKLHVDTILALIKKSKTSILLRDENQQNVLDYWATYYNNYSHETIFSLWEKFKLTSNESGYKNNANYELNLKRDNHGDNFMHTLLRNPNISEEQALKSIEILYTKRDDNGFTDNIALHGCLVTKNTDGEIPTFSLYNKDTDWARVFDLLYKDLASSLMILSKQCQDEADIFFPPNTELFSSNQPNKQHPIYRMLEKEDFERAIKVMEREFKIKSDTFTIYKALRDPLKPKAKKIFEDKHSKVQKYFGKNGFYWKHQGQSVYGYIAEYLCKNPTKQKIIDNNYELFLEIEERLPHIETIAWKKTVMSLDRQISSEELPRYTEQLTKKINTPDYVDQLLPLDHAFLTNNIQMAIFLIEVCHSTIDNRTLANSLSMAPEDDLSIFDYIFNKVFVKNNHEISNYTSLSLFLIILKNDLCRRKYTYLIEKGFNPAATTDDEKRNLLQILLIDSTTQEPDELLSQLEILLDKSINAHKTLELIITNVDTSNNSAVDYLVCERALKDFPEDITANIYKLLIDNLDSIAKLQHNPKVHFLCYPIMLNNVEALNATLERIESLAFKRSILDFRLEGFDISDLIKRRKAADRLSNEFSEIILASLNRWSDELNIIQTAEIIDTAETVETAKSITTILFEAKLSDGSDIFGSISAALNELDSDTRESVITHLDSDRNSIMEHIVYAKINNRISAQTAFDLHKFMLENISSLERTPRPGTGLLLQLILLDHTEGLKHAIPRIEKHPDLITKILTFKERGASLLEIAQKNNELKVLSEEFLKLFQETFDRWSKTNKLAITNKLSM